MRVLRFEIMKEQPSRRRFLQAASILGLCAAGGIPQAPALAQEPMVRVGGPSLKVSLNAYSFAKLLNDQIKHRGPGTSLMDLLDFCAKTGFDGLDPTGYFFPTYPEVPPDAYVNNFKRRAFELGVGISGTGVRNNFTTSDKAVRAAAVQHIKEWVEVAAKLGAPVLRVFADTQMRAMTWQDVAKGFSRDDVQKWIVEALSQCAEQGKKFGVIIGVQNHGDFIQTGDQLLALIKGVNSEWCGAIVDTGYFKTPDPYVDMALVAPYAVNWQIKQSPFGEESEIQTDLVRLIKIVRASNYRGYLPIETLSPKTKVYDPFSVVPVFYKQLRDAIAQTA
jgi:sugar phosphate isomerase/epimerase